MGRSAAGFDDWYAEMGRSSARDLIVRRALGLPPGFDSSGLLAWAGLDDVTAALRLNPGELLVDLACGRGGYGLEIARRTGARVTGVDFSAVAIGAAEGSIERYGLAGRAEYRLGELTDTELAAHSADAVVCLDAIQFAEPPLDALRECRRILVGGGRVVLTCWEAVTPDDARMPERIRRVRLAEDLAAAGFEQIEVADRPDWLEVERAKWEAVRQADPSDAAVRTMQNEAASVLGWLTHARRVCATAVSPAGAADD